MDCSLGQILKEKVVYGTDFANDDVFAADTAVVADTEGVKDGSDEHVFTH